MSLEYEWIIEYTEYDGEEEVVVDCWHYTTLKKLLKDNPQYYYVRYARGIKYDSRIALKRCPWGDNVVAFGYAYVDHTGYMESHFCTDHKVPKRFFKEVERNLGGKE